MAGPIWPGAGGVAIFRRFKFSSHSPHDVSGTRMSMRLQSRKAGPEADIYHTAYPPVIKITNATFYREYPTTESVKKDNPPLYPNLTFSLKSYKVPTKAGEYSSLEHCAVIGSSAKSSFLDILRGRYICVPPTARSYPYLLSPGARAEASSCDAAHAIQYVGFNGDQKQSAGGIRGSYMSARYESRREDTDFTLLQYLKDQTSLNPPVREKEDLREGGNIKTSESDEHLNQIIRDFQLQELLNMPVSNLSNGQTRRARIAKALLMKPEVLLLDEPFSEYFCIYTPGLFF